MGHDILRRYPFFYRISIAGSKRRSLCVCMPLSLRVRLCGVAFPMQYETNPWKMTLNCTFPAGERLILFVALFASVPSLRSLVSKITNYEGIQADMYECLFSVFGMCGACMGCRAIHNLSRTRRISGYTITLHACGKREGELPHRNCWCYTVYAAYDVCRQQYACPISILCTSRFFQWT